MTAKEVKARAAGLRARRAALEERLAAAPGNRELRLELAAVEEELVDCARELRALTPRHKVSYTRTTWGNLEGMPWGGIDNTWAEVEAMEPGEARPTDQNLMRLALRTALVRSMTPAQRVYTQERQAGKSGARIGRERDRDKSTISRTLSRGRARLERNARAMYAVLKAQTGQCGGLTLDLAEPAVLAAVLDLLTDRQRLCLYLYYGEWLSTREIAAMTDTGHVSVLRCIRRGLERLDQILVGSQVAVTGLDALEEQLIAYYNAADLEPLRQRTGRKGHSPSFYIPMGGYIPRWFSKPERTMQLIRDGESRAGPVTDGPRLEGGWGSGRLLALLEQAAGRRLARQPELPLASRLRWIGRAVRDHIYRVFRALRRGLQHADYY